MYRKVYPKIENYRFAVFGDIEITEIRDTPHGKCLMLRQQQLDFYRGRELQEKIASFEQTGVFNGFFQDVWVYYMANKQGKEKLCTYQGLTYNEYDSYVGLSLRYPELEHEPNYRYSAVWFRKAVFEDVSSMLNICVGGLFPGHIKTYKFPAPVFEGHEPFVKANGQEIYYASEWCSDYIPDEDCMDKMPANGPDGEIETEKGHYAAYSNDLVEKILIK